MKGIILAAGYSQYLKPVTTSISKYLLPIYDKPIIYYPLHTLMLLGIRDILVICNSDNMLQIVNLLGDGSQLGINISYSIQLGSGGIAESILIGEEFIGNDSVSIILGDSIFFGGSFDVHNLQKDDGACIFYKRVNNPWQFGVIELDQFGTPLSIEEKPLRPKSSNAVTGLYVYDNKCIEYAHKLNPSHRNKLEITDISKCYLSAGKLHAVRLPKDVFWSDVRTANEMLDVSNYIKVESMRNNASLGCIEEVAYNNWWITEEELCKLADACSYGSYLKSMLYLK